LATNQRVGGSNPSGRTTSVSQSLIQHAISIYHENTGDSPGICSLLAALHLLSQIVLNVVAMEETRQGDWLSCGNTLDEIILFLLRFRADGESIEDSAG
jgi:hypothetical protein